MCRGTDCACLQDLLLKCVTDTEVEAIKVLSSIGVINLSEEACCDVLALRGLLACGILEHSLQMRHLVDYGVNRCVPNLFAT